MLNYRQFCQMFRMARECFTLLCDKIKVAVGEENFKTEDYIESFLHYPGHIYYANCASTGGYILGEVNLAVAIRILVGGDLQDIGVIFDIPSNYCRTIMHQVIEE